MDKKEEKERNKNVMFNEFYKNHSYILDGMLVVVRVDVYCTLLLSQWHQYIRIPLACLFVCNKYALIPSMHPMTWPKNICVNLSTISAVYEWIYVFLLVFRSNQKGEKSKWILVLIENRSHTQFTIHSSLIFGRK